MRIIIFLFFFSSGVHAWSLFAPNNYNDCILANIKDNQSTPAIFAIKKACRSKFPMSDAEKECEDLNNNMHGLTFAEIREIPEFKNASDDEIIAHAKSIGWDENAKKLIAEKRCKNMGFAQ